jgi:apolipoprotein D and lipocalin family protein
MATNTVRKWSMRRCASFLFIFFGVALMFGAKAPLEVVPRVDWNRYQGKWFEIARFPNRFEKECVSDVTADYSLKPGTVVEVLNTCRKANGDLKKSVGVSKSLDKDPTTPRLRLSFLWPFYGDYWILELDSDNSWALVGEPDREYLWILSRKPTLDESIYRKLVASAKAKGFDASKLVPTKQN